MNTRYILLTGAKNEEADIEKVILSVLRQTVLPTAWFIVDDNSSDRTVSIVERFAQEHPFIHLHSIQSRGDRNFESKDRAVMAAYELARPLDFTVVGLLDADTAPEQNNYYESILEEFDRNPRLGIAGGFIYERPLGRWESRPSNSRDSVAGPAVFRRLCFDQVGGYFPMKYGGSDWLIQLDAKMSGWEVKTRPDLHILHYRPTSSVGGIWRGMFRAGLMDASFGSDALFEVFKCGRRIMNRPPFLGCCLRFCGFLWWRLTGREPLIPAEKVAFLRGEQRAKLRRWMTRPGVVC